MTRHYSSGVTFGDESRFVPLWVEGFPTYVQLTLFQKHSHSTVVEQKRSQRQVAQVSIVKINHEAR